MRDLGVGFTLIEILIALAIAGVLAALIGPPFVRWIGEYRFRETVSQFEAAMVRVRADAQRGGGILEVSARHTSGRLRLMERQTPLNVGYTGQDGSAEADVKERLVFEFPAGFGLGEPEGAGSSPGQSEGMAPPPEMTAPAASAVSSDAPPSVLVLFLPDGSAVAGAGPAVIVDGGGRQARLKINSWTGRVELVPVDSLAGAPAGTRRERGRRRKSWAPRSRRPARTGALLLETMVALAIFVAGGLSVLAMVNRAAASMVLARDYRAAADLARSAMARIEAGIASPQTLHGPVEAWDGGAEVENESSFEDAPPPPSGWELEISTEPSSFEGLTLVTVRALRRTADASERTKADYTLRQLVRLGGGGSDSVGDVDPLMERVPAQAPGSGESSPEGGPR